MLSPDIVDHMREYAARRRPEMYERLRRIVLAIRRFMKSASEQEIIFTRIYRAGGWGCNETVSGVGSTMANTENIRSRLPGLLKEYSIQTLLDVPCGDFHWMREVHLGTTKYIGGEIVRALVERNSKLYTTPHRTFVHLDILTSKLPDSDAILCRDCLPHFPIKDIVRALHNIKRTRATYLITSHYTSCTVNEDTSMGRFRRLNLEREPFSFPPPLVQLEDVGGGYNDKALALWRISELQL